MTVLLPYLLKLSLSLAVVFLFYQLVLRRLTFYNWNRWYLLLYSLMVFVLPFIDISTILERNDWSQHEFVTSIPVIAANDVIEAIPVTNSQPIISVSGILLILFLTGILAATARLLIQYISLRKIRRNASLLWSDGVKVYQVNKPIIPFSFGNAIYLNQHLHHEEELKEIIRHEFIHVKQRHSADIIWSEILCILNWYNPFAWLIRKAIRQNLEFIADHHVLQNGIDRKQYQYLLLKVTGISSFSITNQFNFSSLKKRIAMMNKTKSAHIHLGRFLLLLPLVAIVLLAFRSTVKDQKPSSPELMVQVPDTVGKNAGLGDITADKTIVGEDGLIYFEGNVWLSVDKASPAAFMYKGREYSAREFSRILSKKQPFKSLTIFSGQAIQKYFGVEGTDKVILEIDGARSLEFAKSGSENKAIIPGKVRSIEDNDGIATVTLANGKQEKYDLNDPEQKKALMNKYGEIPTQPSPPAPPTPPSPTVPAGQSPVLHEASPAPPAPGQPGDLVGILEQTMIRKVRDANGETIYHMDIPAERAAYEKRMEHLKKTQSPPPDETNVRYDGRIYHVKGKKLAVIDNRTTREQLEKLITSLANKGFTLKIGNKNFSDGRLTSLSGSITDPGGKITSFEGDSFSQIIIREAYTDTNADNLKFAWVTVN